jgi:hypothetical protein
MTHDTDNHDEEQEKAAGSEVGYGKPPVHTRFRKGQSGNPRGRAKGTLNLVTRVQKELNQKVTITENGKRRQVTKLDAAVKQLVNKAASGDHRATRSITEIITFAEAREPVDTHVNDRDEKAVLQGIQARLLKYGKGEADV